MKATLKLNPYKGIEELPLYNFDKYRKTLDCNWFLEGYNGQQKKIEQHLLKPIEKEINNQYYEATDDRSFQSMIKILAKIDVLQTKYEVVTILVERMWKGFGHDKAQQETRAAYVQELGKWGFKMNIISTVDEDAETLASIHNALRGVMTQIRLLENELKKDETKVSATLEKQVLMVGLALQTGYKIDPKKTTVLEWIEMVKLAQEKAKQN